MGHETRLAARDFAALLLIAVIWGVNNLFAKMIVQHMPPLFAAGARFAITAGVMALFMRPIGPSWKAMLAICVIMGPLHFGVQNIGLAMAHDLTPMVIGMQLWIPASIAAAAIMLGERPSGLRAMGLVLAFGGVVVLAFEPSVFGQIGALGLVAFAAVIYGVCTVLVRKQMSLDPLQMQGWMAFVSAPLLFAGSAVAEPGQIVQAAGAPAWVWAMIAFGALASSLIANALMFRLVQVYEVARTTPYVLLSPPIGVALGVIVLKDPVSAQLLIGAAIALVGVAIVALAERRRG